ncbi:MAG: hypothetical protein HDQ97_19550 [Lachnospiraceae bacterium]|nr:hypothetical protein [Lachnospiraceae bacterium]
MKEIKLNSKKKETILKSVEQLLQLYHNGELGGETMPEDANPELESGTKENYLYFTLPMALNYQRNSYKLWEAAKAAYLDAETNDVFLPESVIQMPQEDLRDKPLKYKVALQPNKHVEIWLRLCSTFVDRFQGDVRTLFLNNDNSVKKVKEYILANKKSFPYLSGTKILNYWLYVMSQYTDGEPLVRKDFMELVIALKEKGIAIRQIYTNGMQVSKELFDSLKELGLRPEFSLNFDGVGWHN